MIMPVVHDIKFDFNLWNYKIVNRKSSTNPRSQTHFRCCLDVLKFYIGPTCKYSKKISDINHLPDVVAAEGFVVLVPVTTMVPPRVTWWQELDNRWKGARPSMVHVSKCKLLIIGETENKNTLLQNIHSFKANSVKSYSYTEQMKLMNTSFEAVMSNYCS